MLFSLFFFLLSLGLKHPIWTWFKIFEMQPVVYVMYLHQADNCYVTGDLYIKIYCGCFLMYWYRLIAVDLKRELVIHYIILLTI